MIQRQLQQKLNGVLEREIETLQDEVVVSEELTEQQELAEKEQAAEQQEEVPASWRAEVETCKAELALGTRFRRSCSRSLKRHGQMRVQHTVCTVSGRIAKGL